MSPVVVLAVLLALLASPALADDPAPDPAPAAAPKPDPAPPPAAPDPAPQPPPPPAPPPPPPTPPPSPPPPPVYVAPPPAPSPAPQPPPPPAPAKKAPAKPKPKVKKKPAKKKPAKKNQRVKAAKPKPDAPVVIRLTHGKRMVELRDSPKPHVPKHAAPQTTGVVPIAAVRTPGGSGSVPWLFVGPLALALLALGAAVLPQRTLAASPVLRLIEPRRLDLAIWAFILVGSVLIALAVTRSG